VLKNKFAGIKIKLRLYLAMAEEKILGTSEETA
jgi:hypothetical protein